MKVNKFFNTTKYLWIGGILGFSQQLLGRVDYFLYRGREIFSFSGIMSGLSFWAAAILLLIFRKNISPREQFRDIFLFFLGLDFFYYLYIFIMELVIFCYVKLNNTVLPHDVAYYFQQTCSEIFDFIKWTTIGTAAAVWGYFTTKLSAKKKKISYILIMPLFLVIIIELFDYSDSMIRFIIQEYKAAHNMPLPENMFYVCTISQFLTSLTALTVCSIIFIKNMKNKNKFPIKSYIFS